MSAARIKSLTASVPAGRHLPRDCTAFMPRVRNVMPVSRIPSPLSQPRTWPTYANLTAAAVRRVNVLLSATVVSQPCGLLPHTRAFIDGTCEPAAGPGKQKTGSP